MQEIDIPASSIGRFTLVMGIAVATAIIGYSSNLRAQAPHPAASSTGKSLATSSQSEPPQAFDEWPLPAPDHPYGAIDGKHMWKDVVEQALIARRYRDQGHPQFWGRIIGTSGDAESAQWLLDKFQKLGLADTHIQPIDLAPQWMPQSWEISVNGGGKAISLSSAQPAYRTPGTDKSNLDLEAVYVGLGSEADFLGRDVRGKAVFISSVYPPGFCPQCPVNPPNQPNAMKLAEQKGAAAIFYVYTGLPGNVHYQSYPTNTAVPTFVLGSDDGQQVEDLIAQATGGVAPHVKVRLDVEMVPNLKTALVWGTLPGATDETIYVIAHRDGWFDASGDNGGGVASMIGLAEYFSKIPRSKRRRTMVFIGIDGHHNSGPGAAAGALWLASHRDTLFAKTALMINDEHPANVAPYIFEGRVGLTDTYAPLMWYAGGSSRPELAKLAKGVFREFGVWTWDLPSLKPPPGDLGRFYTFLPGIAAASNDFFYFHTDANTPETVPWTGLEAVTRAFAKIIDEVNQLSLKDLERPVEAPTSPTRRQQ